MIIREKSTGTVHTAGRNKTQEQVLERLGLAVDDVEVYTKAEWELTSYYTDAMLAKAAAEQEATTNQAALDKVRARLPELASDTAMSVVYALWKGIDDTQVKTALKLALSEWATTKGLPDVTV